MKRVTPTARTAIAAGIISTLVLSMGELKIPVEPPLVAGQAPILLPGQTSPDDVDMTPAERSAEVQALLRGTTFAPDPGEPAGAIVTYFTTQEKMRKAGRRIEEGKLPGEPDFDPAQLLDEALAMRQRAAVLYPTSRHAWQGLGELSWQQYLRQHRSPDLRRAVEAYTKVAEILTSRMQQDPGTTDLRSFTTAVRTIANGLAALSDRASLESFFARLQVTKAWPYARLAYAVALGSLNDSRADGLFQEELRSMPPGETLLSYVDYLWSQNRYQDALRVLDMKDRSKLHAVVRAERGTILEKLGRLNEARTEYQSYFDEAAKRSSGPWPWPMFVPDRYRIPGSALQQNIRFGPPVDEIPKPQSSLWPLLGPASAWASHVQTPLCGSSDWSCKSYWYAVRAIHGETGCINTASTCWGTVGGQRAVAWNMRNRVFYGLGRRFCPSADVCFNYAAGVPLVNNSADTTALSRRYYYVIDEGYIGVGQSMTQQEQLEAEQIGYDVLVYGNVPDPNAGRCKAGYPTGDTCSGGCSEQGGYWDSILPTGSVEFRSGKVDWKNAQNAACRWEELMPSAVPTGTRCGAQCYTPSLGSGATCPRIGTLKREGCGPPSEYQGPWRGNYYWKFYQPQTWTEPFPGAVSRDFNDDWKADVLWRHTSGAVLVYLMSGPTVAETGSPGSLTVDWHIAGVGDFNGDGKVDILWRNSTSGTLMMWLMNGTSLISQPQVGTIGLDWTIAGVGDFNNDGRADILLRRADGTLSIYLMDGPTISNVGSPGSVAPDWQIAGVGDFNWDGKADIVWRDNSGALHIWLMDGTTRVSSASPGGFSTDWEIVRVADFNADGGMDVLWRHPNSGALIMWLMYGTTVISEGHMGSVGLEWAIADVGDFNGDGQADILWRRTDGTLMMFLMSGAAIAEIGWPGNVPLDWQAVNTFAATSSTSLSVSPATVVRGASVSATWSEIPSPTSRDWIGLYAAGAGDTAVLAWVYVSCSQVPSSPLSSGSCSFGIPQTVAPGTYELRLYRNDGYTRLATSNGFTVTSSGTSLSVNPSTVSAGGSVIAAWSGIVSPTASDWIGLYALGSADTAYLAWMYVSCSTTPSGAWAEGACWFAIPNTLTAGPYELRLFANDGYTRLATSNGLTVY
jgi:VCBS repeat protein